ncbi:MAG: SAM-dependent methyltransferase [Paludibacteraceae bacterium]|nr:SAM-dependent methyltransferase [Paludibacteraceae bacterium]
MVEIGDPTKAFIAKHRDDDVRNLALHPGKVDGVDLPLALRQIEGWQVALKKLPSWAEVDGLLYPPHISLEQCSSEQTALYKSRLLKGGSLVDLTGGFGVDFSYLSRKFEQATYVERQELLCEAASHNFPLLGLPHAEVVCAQATDFLSAMPAVDCIYLDPARRDQYGRKVVSLVDCEPDLTLLLPALFEKSKRILVKYSPMLDLSSALAALQGVTEVHVVALHNECKELLFLFDRERRGEDMKIVCANLTRKGLSEISFTREEEREASCSLAKEVGKYLYEPNVSILKGGAYRLLSQRYSVSKLDVNTHLYTSDEMVPDFPGRIFEVESCFSMGKSELKQNLAGVESANLSVRNFPQTVLQLRTKLKLKEGGDLYLFATTLAGKKVLVKCTKATSVD